MTRDSDDWLDAALADEATYLADDGFTDGVMRALPARRRSYRVLILASALLLACAIAFVVFPSGTAVLAAVSDLVRFGRAPFAATFPVLSLALVALVVWGTAALALAGDDRAR